MREATEQDGVTPYALYPLRLGLALVFIVYGWNKFQNLSGTEAMFDGWGIPFAGVAVVLVAIAEFFGGIGILLGVLPRFSSAVLSLVMVTAMVTVKLPGPIQAGAALEIGLLAGTLTVVVNGAGRPTVWSVFEELGVPLEQRVRDLFTVPWRQA